MKNEFYVCLLSIILVCCSGKTTTKPYEATWLEITKTDSGYVVYNYPSLWDEGITKNPMKISVNGNKLIWITFSDEPTSYNLEGKIEEGDNNNCIFKVGNYFRFESFDKDKHIAKWIIYHGDDRSMSNSYYIDSIYNTFPSVDFEWGEH